MEKLNWGILAAAKIAQAMVDGIKSAGHCRVLAVASRSSQKATEFARQHNIPRAYGSYEEMLGDPEIDVVYIATPHPHHAEWSIKAAQAGKHVLCEKPAALNHTQAMAMIEAADKAGVFFMEAFMYRCHPQIAILLKLLKEGRIGEVRLIQASFGFQVPFNAESRLFNNDLGGGAILDVGCYTVSLARLVAGAAQGTAFADPLTVRAQAVLGKTGVDELALAVLQFDNNILAQVSTSIALRQKNQAVIFGTEGRIEITNPWTANRQQAEKNTLFLYPNHSAKPETMVVDVEKTAFAYEAEVVAAAIRNGCREASAPAMSWNDTLGNMRTLDRWRREIDLVYDSEK